jgi:hypothetical protein
VPGMGEVTNGMNNLDIRFCSVKTDFSCSSKSWMSKARETSFTNFTDSAEARGVVIGCVSGDDSESNAL